MDDGTTRVEHLDPERAEPVEIEVEIGSGRVDVTLEEGGGVGVEIRHEPASGLGWPAGLSGLLGMFAGSAGGDVDLGAAAVRDAEVSYSAPAARLVVRSSRALPLRAIPLAVTVTAPHRSRLAVRAGSADVTVTGTAAWLAVRTGSGDVVGGQVDGDAEVQTGSGSIRLGAVAGRLRGRSGSGDIDATAVAGPTELVTGSGDVWLGEVSGDVAVRTGSGQLAVADAASGSLELTTGSGSLRVGVHAGVLAEVDLGSGSGRARSDLPVGETRPEQPAALHVRGRTGSGDALITSARS